MHRKSLIIGVAIMALAIPAVASATGEQAHMRLAKGSTAINAKTCKFLHRELDPATPGVGPSLGTALIALGDLRFYTLYEDARHDAKLACLTHRLGRNGVGGPGPRGPRGFTGKTGPAGPAGPPGSGSLAGYVQVTAKGTGATVTATCPVGDVVLGGGSPDETTGSYPSSASAWTVKRDHLSPRVVSVTAVCAKAAS